MVSSNTKKERVSMRNTTAKSRTTEMKELRRMMEATSMLKISISRLIGLKRSTSKNSRYCSRPKESLSKTLRTSSSNPSSSVLSML